jgi:hypothetical protein
MSDRSPDSKDAAFGDLVIPALAIAFALYFFDSIWDLAWEARATGVVVGTVLLVLVALLVLRVARRLLAGRATLSFGPLLGPWPYAPQRIGIVLLCALFIAVLPWLGLTLGLFVLTSALMFLLGAGNWRAIVTISGIVSAAAYVLFVALLNTRMPHGPIENLLRTFF